MSPSNQGRLELILWRTMPWILARWSQTMAISTRSSRTNRKWHSIIHVTSQRDFIKTSKTWLTNRYKPSYQLKALQRLPWHPHLRRANRLSPLSRRLSWSQSRVHTVERFSLVHKTSEVIFQRNTQALQTPIEPRRKGGMNWQSSERCEPKPNRSSKISRESPAQPTNVALSPSSSNCTWKSQKPQMKFPEWKF